MASLGAEEFAQLDGKELGLSGWIVIDQNRVDQFARATGDFQFIHVEPERARQTPYGGTIAHGFLTLSLFPMLAEQADLPVLAGLTMGINYGGNRTRFLSPVRVGAKVRGRFRQLSFKPVGPGQYRHTIDYSVEIEGENKPALAAEWVLQYFV